MVETDLADRNLELIEQMSMTITDHDLVRSYTSLACSYRQVVSVFLNTVVLLI